LLDCARGGQERCCNCRTIMSRPSKPSAQSRKMCDCAVLLPHSRTLLAAHRPLPRSGTRFASGLNDMCRESDLLVPAPSGPIQPGVKGAGRKTKARTKNPKICLSVQTGEWDHRVIGITSERRRAMFFRDRADAARQLAARLKGRPLRDPVVLAVPRGGVVTG